jgi:hypothetical protein
MERHERNYLGWSKTFVNSSIIAKFHVVAGHRPALLHLGNTPLTLFLPRSGKNMTAAGDNPRMDGQMTSTALIGSYNSACRQPQVAPTASDGWPLRTELHCALETGYMVTSLSINNLAGYKSVTHQLHGYIVFHQQLRQQHSATGRQHPETYSLCAPLDTVLGSNGAARRSSPIKNSVKLRTQGLFVSDCLKFFGQLPQAPSTLPHNRFQTCLTKILLPWLRSCFLQCEKWRSRQAAILTLIINN